MKRKNCTDGVNEMYKEDGVIHEIRKSSGGVKLGDLIWVKLHPSAWWPAQVVDADTVSEAIKPSERSVGEVLVRVYGSYLYLYVDPLESRTEFAKILKMYNSNYDQILEESLEKVCPCSSEYGGQKESDATQYVGEDIPETLCDASPDDCNNAQGKHDDMSGSSVSENVPKQKGGKLLSGMKGNSRKKNITVLQKHKESAFQLRVSPRLKFSSNKLETTFMNDNPTSELDSTTGVEKSCQTKQKLHSQNTDNETAHGDSKTIGKVDKYISIPHQEVVTVSVHEGTSARSKRIMQSLGLIAPYGSPFHLT